MAAFKMFCGGGSVIPHIASVGPAPKDALLAALEASEDEEAAQFVGWASGFKEIGGYLEARGIPTSPPDRICDRIGVEMPSDDGHGGAEHATVRALFLALKLLDDADASGWALTFDDEGRGVRLRAQL